MIWGFCFRFIAPVDGLVVNPAIENLEFGGFVYILEG
jgi:hypothetical protein